MVKSLSKAEMRRVAMAYGATSLGGAAIHNLFLSYYIHLFLVHYHLTDWWFYFGELVYMVWNSLNDPLIAYYMDSAHWEEDSRTAHRGKGGKVKKRHLDAIKYGGFCWALSLLLMFAPFVPSTPLSEGGGEGEEILGREFGEAYVGMLFLLSLCFYDTFLSYVMLGHGALLADFTSWTEVRSRCNNASSVGGMIGSLSVFLSHWFWSPSDLSVFRIYAFVVCCVAVFCFQFTAQVFEKFTLDDMDEQPSLHSSPHPPPSKLTLGKFLKQLFKMRNFWIFVSVNLVQVFNCHFLSNFMTIFLDQLLPSSPSSLSSSSSSSSSSLPSSPPVSPPLDRSPLEASSSSLSSPSPLPPTSPFSPTTSSLIKMVVISSSSFLPHFLVLSVSPLLSRWGLYSLLSSLFFFKIFLSFFAFWFDYLFLPSFGDVSGGVFPVVFLLFYLLSSKVFNEVICRHGNLVLADLVDEDNYTHTRPTSASSLIFGVNAFFTKPGQSLAPIFGWKLLSTFGGVVGGGGAEGRRVGGGEGVDGGVIFRALVAVPGLCGVVQGVLWMFFTLHSSYLEQVKGSLKMV